MPTKNSIEHHVGLPKVLTAEEQARYRDDGYLCPVPAIGAEEASSILRKVESVEHKHGGAWPKEQAFKPHTLYPWLNELIRHPAILDAVEDILGPDILCWQSRFFIKDSNDGGFVSWHQDVTYWGVDITENILTAWLALTPATAANGVMKVIPGSHHNRLLPHREGAGSKLTVRGQEIAVNVDESKAVYMELEPGEMSLHHALLFHGSDVNTSMSRRVGLAIRYLPTRVKPLPGLPRDYVTLVRGIDHYHHFHHETPPKSELDSGALEQYRITSQTYAAINAESARRHREHLNVAR